MAEDFPTHMIRWLEAHHVRQTEKGAFIRYEAIVENTMALVFSYDRLSSDKACFLEMEVAALPFDKNARGDFLLEMLNLNRSFILRDGFGLKLSQERDSILLQKTCDALMMAARDFEELLEAFLANGKRARGVFQKFVNASSPESPSGKIYL